MKRTLLVIFCFFLFNQITVAQYTRIINSNKPGYVQTPYALGSNVFQFENTLLTNRVNLENQDINSYTNDFNFRFGIGLEKLEAIVNHRLTSKEGTTGTELFSVGVKYLIYTAKERNETELKRSWKKRFEDQSHKWVPSVAVLGRINTPFVNKTFNSDGTSFSFSTIAQNHLSRTTRLNTQIDFNYIGTKAKETVIATSYSFVYAKRFNPYIELRYHSFENLNYTSLGIGTPFLVNQNLSISSHISTSFSSKNNYSGFEFGLNASYRIDKHLERLKYKQILAQQRKLRIEEAKKSRIERLEKETEELFNEDVSKETKEGTASENVDVENSEDNQSKDELLREYAKEQDKKLKELEKQELEEEERARKQEEKYRKAEEKRKRKEEKRAKKLEKKRLKQQAKEEVEEEKKEKKQENNYIELY